MSVYITTQNSSGHTVFSGKADKKPRRHALPDGTVQILSMTHHFPINVSTEIDIDTYLSADANGLQGRLCPPNGTSILALDVEPNTESEMHRTTTFDVCIVIDGVLELHLDSGETRTLRAGDVVQQRAGMHKWVNVTPNDGWAKMIGVVQPVVEPSLETDKEG